MSDPVSTFTVVSGAANILGGLSSSANEREQNRVAEQQALYNAKQYRYDKQLAYYEKAMSFGQQLARGRQDIATGRGQMVAAGNYGSSAQSQIFGSSLNLMKDLSALQYKYDNEAIQYENQARVEEYNASVYRKNRKKSVLGDFLNVAAGVGQTYLSGWKSGVWGPTIEEIRGL